jgi:phosphatidylglycerophosphatase A
MKSSWVAYLVTWFGSGYAPKASGTFGSIAALAPAYFIREYLGWQALLAMSWVMFLVGVWLCEKYLVAIGEKCDPKEVVIDEVAGIWLTLAFLPHNLWGYAFGFVLFRAFDIVKPFPISWLDRRFKCAFGIMIDDMAAGAFAAATYLIIRYFTINAFVATH